MGQPSILRLGALALLALAATGCVTSSGYWDFDGDGFSDALDCAPADPETYPGADDQHGDGKDQDCDGADGRDADGDGYPVGLDCDDGNVLLNLNDLDEDGFTSCAGDCDDTDAGLHPEDNDDDSFSPCEGDCNDARDDVNPAAEEICDGLDSDCNGSMTEQELDGDGDGTPACGDCDDNDPDRSPEHIEVCDGEDNDCDETSWAGEGEVDMDGDGETPCEGDCDDKRVGIHSGAQEVCDDADNDCDGQVDEDGDLDGDGACGSQDCDDNDPDRLVGAWDGIGDQLDSNCDGADAVDLLGEARLLFDPLWGSGFGSALDGNGDFDGDGLPDLAIGAALSDRSAATGGSVFVRSGAEGMGTVLGTNLETSAIRIDGSQEEGTLGSSLSWVGDLDGDGLDELLIGEPDVGFSQDDSGWARLFLGSTLSSASVLDGNDADVVFTPPGNVYYAGTSVDGGHDVDGDGIGDLVIGASGSNAGGTVSGAVYIVSGADALSTPTYDLTNAWATLHGTGGGQWVGYRVHLAPNLDDDDRADLLVLSDTVSTAGAYTTGNKRSHIHLVRGSDLGSGGSFNMGLSGISGAILEGEEPGDAAGEAMSVGDTDGDGLSDIALGAHLYSVGMADRGRAYLVLGASIVWDSQSSLSTADLIVDAETPASSLGRSVDLSGDLDGDGLNDLLVGTPTTTAAGGYGLTAAFFSSEILSSPRSVFSAESSFVGTSYNCGYALTTIVDTSLGHSRVVIGDPGTNRAYVYPF